MYYISNQPEIHLFAWTLHEENILQFYMNVFDFKYLFESTEKKKNKIKRRMEKSD